MPMKFSNGLTDSQLERLALLSEELGEAQQCIGKIIRHGYESFNPCGDEGSNRFMLIKELGDVTYAIEFLCTSGDLNHVLIQRRSSEKCEKVKKWLHHQSPLPSPPSPATDKEK